MMERRPLAASRPLIGALFASLCLASAGAHVAVPTDPFAGYPAASHDALTVVTDDDSDPKPIAGHVIHISVDGLRADGVTRLSRTDLPNFYRLRTEGAFTDNARTDVHYSNTLPNHASQLTGRAVLGPDGHNWRSNRDPDPGETLHSNKGEYVASVFDVVHDHGLSTALFTSKSKFVVFDQSYDETSGRPDRIGPDNGRDKIDRYVYERDSEELVDAFVRDMKMYAYEYAFIHLRDPDTAGHWHHWSTRSGSSYMKSIRDVDRLLGRILEMVSTTPALAGNTVIILTADHGGGGEWHDHGDASDVMNYTIPFYVWGSGVEHAELYAMNRESRRHPGMKRPGYDATLQPIRNGDAANLALARLGLPSVPGSNINMALDLSPFRTHGSDSPELADTVDAPGAASSK